MTHGNQEISVGRSRCGQDLARNLRDGAVDRLGQRLGFLIELFWMWRCCGISPEGALLTPLVSLWPLLVSGSGVSVRGN